MGLMNWLGLAPAVTRAAEVFVPNRTQGQAQGHARAMASLEQMGAEFARPPRGGFDAAVDGLNRLPRPALALGTLALFAFAMADPAAFGVRMQGLALVPEPMWWLLGAIVSFYFGARELHHRRSGRAAGAGQVADTLDSIAAIRGLRDAPATEERTEDRHAPAAPQLPLDGNAALAEWRALNGG